MKKYGTTYSLKDVIFKWTRRCVFVIGQNLILQILKTTQYIVTFIVIFGAFSFPI